MCVLAFAYFTYLIFFAGLTAEERRRAYVLIALFIGCAIFFAGYEQMGASFNLFAQRYTERHLFGWEVPAGVLQAVNPLFIILFAPVFALLWLFLGRHNRDLSAPAKFGAGLIFLGLRLPDHVRGRRLRAGRPEGRHDLAGVYLPDAHLGRVVSVAGRDFPR